MAAGPTIVATIKADDQESAAIHKLSAMAREASENTAKVTGRATRDASAMIESMAARHGAAVDSMSQRLGAFAAKIDGVAAGAFAGLGQHVLRETLAIGGEMSRIERRTAAFTDFTKRQLEDIRTRNRHDVVGRPRRASGRDGCRSRARHVGRAG